MSFAELDIAPRTRGRAPALVEAVRVRDIREADLAVLASSRESTSPHICGPLRERHHALARVLAQGMADADAASVTGYSLSRISILKRDPSFIELLAHYRGVENGLLAEFSQRASQLSMTAMDAILDELEDAPEKVPLATKLEIAKFAADRTGHAPVQKNLNINANVDLGNRLSAARRRLASAATTDATFESVEEGSGGPTLGDET